VEAVSKEEAVEVSIVARTEEEIPMKVAEVAEPASLSFLLTTTTGTSVEMVISKFIACTRNPPEEVEAKVPSKIELLSPDSPISM
jgi:hypothetical protein